MTDIDKLILVLSPIISLLGLALGYLRWKGSEKNVDDSNAVNNFADAASKTAGLNERLQAQIDAHVKDKSLLQAKIDEAAKLIAELKDEKARMMRDHEAWQDRNIDLAKRVGVLSQNYEGVQKELERIRRWGYANAAEVTRLGGTPIRLEDVRG